MKEQLQAFHHKADVNILIKNLSKSIRQISSLLLAEHLTELNEIIKRRIGQKVIGFGADPNTIVEEESFLSKLIPEDLQRFGLIPEFIGRLPVLASLEPLERRYTVSNSDTSEKCNCETVSENA